MSTEQLGFDLGTGTGAHPRLSLWFDGASRGNGQRGARAAIGGLVRDADSGEVLAEVSEAIGEETNNVAEYRALLAALEAAAPLRAQEISIRGDSALVINQLRGEWKVKAAHLHPLIRAVHTELARYQRVELVHVRREHNTEADALANQALDAAADR